DERDDFAARIGVDLGLHRIEGFGYGEFRIVENFVALLDFITLLGREGGAAEADAVETVRARRIPFDEKERRDVFGELGCAADHRVPSDARELMHAGLTADGRVCTDL